MADRRSGLSLVSYVGGKGTHLDALLPLIPYTKTYVEPYGGGASVLLNRRTSPVEVYNDLNGDLTNLFRVVRDPKLGPIFEQMVAYTLFSRDEFRLALATARQHWRDVSDEPLESLHRAWATYVILNQGISGKLHRSEGNWSRSKDSDLNTRRWWRKVERVGLVAERMANVQIDSCDALECIAYWDAPDTTFYLDPPYVLDTRDGRQYYAVEQDDAHHAALVELILNVAGSVVLSGYDHDVYDPLVAAGWAVEKYTQTAVTTIAVKGETKPVRVECVWRNPRCLEGGVQVPLFTA